MEDIIKTIGLSKYYKKTKVVEDVNLHVKKKDIYGFIGKNGAGKTTTIRMLLNLIEPTEGSVELFGEEVNHKNIYKHLRNIGAIIETPGFYQNLTGAENLDIHRRMMDITDKGSIEEAMRIVGLQDNKNKKVGQYSLGMKQRLGIARALLHQPDLLILDEPTNGLDPQGVVEIRDLIVKIAEQGKTIMISSHILAEVEKMVTKIGILHKGKLVEEIDKEEFDQKCSQSVFYKVDEPQKAMAMIKEYLGTQEVVFESGYISFPTMGIPNIGKLNKRLIDNGINVLESKIVKSSLEDYFMKVTLD